MESLRLVIRACYIRNTVHFRMGIRGGTREKWQQQERYCVDEIFRNRRGEKNCVN